MNDAGVNAIKAIGKDTGARWEVLDLRRGQRRTDQRPVHRDEPCQVPRRHLPRHRGERPAERRAEGRVRELLPQRRRLPRDRLGNRDRARLAVLHRHPRDTGLRQDGRPVGDDQGRRPRSRRDRRACPQYWNRTDAWYNFTANVRGVSHVLATVVEDPFGPQPQGQVLDGIAGGTMGADHPVVWCKDYKGGRSFYTALGNTAGSFDESAFRSQLEGAIDWTAGVADTRLQRLRRDRARELPADQDQRAAEPERADRLRPAPRRADHPDRPPRRHPPARPARRGRRGHRDDPGLHPQRGRHVRPGAIDNNFATNKWVYLYYSPPNVDNITLLGRHDGPHEQLRRGLRPVEQCRPHPGRQHLRLRLLDRLLPAVAVQVRRRRPGRARRTSTSPASSRSCASRSTAAPAATSPATSTSTSTTTSGSPTGDDSAAGSGDAGAFGQSIDQQTDENQTVRVNERDGRHVHADVQRADDRPARVQLDGRADLDRAAGAQHHRHRQRPGHRRPGEHRERARHLEGHLRGGERPTLTADAAGLTGGTPTVTIGVGAGAGGNNTAARQGGLWRMPAADSAALGAEHERPPRQAAADQGQGRRHHSGRRQQAPTSAPAAHTRSRPATCSRSSAGVPQAKTKAGGLRDGLPEPVPDPGRRERRRVRQRLLARLAARRSSSAGPRATGRFQIVRHPANYGWPYCYKTDLP